MAETKKLHIAMFPWLAFGHLIPFLELSKLLAQKGHLVSFISTPRNIQRLPKLPPHLVHLINFVQLPLPPQQNLPQDAEATLDVPLDKIPYLKAACDDLQDSIAGFLKSSDLDWIVYDFVYYWLPPITAELSISRAFFSIFPAVIFGFFLPPLNDDDDEDGAHPPLSKPIDFTVSPPWVPFPSTIACHLYEAKKALHLVEENLSGVSDSFRAIQAIRGCDVFLVRSCLEIEPEWLDLIGKHYHKTIVPVGLLPPPSQTRGDQDDDDDGNDDDDHHTAWLKLRTWLDRFGEKSLVYVAFGSEIRPSQDELNELALGLEDSQLPFLWALRKHKHDENQLLPEGFEDRTADRGLVWTSWAPQLKILSHKSVGIFLNHCGWSSVIEWFHLGSKPLVMFPHSPDQGLIARMLEQKGLGIEISRNEEDGVLTRASVAESLRLAATRMLDDGEKSNACNEQEQGVTMSSSKAFGDDERQREYADQCVEFLQQHRAAVIGNRAIIGNKD